MPDKDENNPHVTRLFCDERFKRVESMFQRIDEKLDEKEKQYEAWKIWLLGIVSSVVSALIVAYLV